MIYFDLYNVRSGGGVIQAKNMLMYCNYKNIIIVSKKCNWISSDNFVNSKIKFLGRKELFFFRMSILFGLHNKKLLYVNPAGNWASLRYPSYLFLQNMLYYDKKERVRLGYKL